jgi:hypothetical protein
LVSIQSNGKTVTFSQTPPPKITVRLVEAKGKIKYDVSIHSNNLRKENGFVKRNLVFLAECGQWFEDAALK